MRWLVGYVGAAIVAALVATAWIAVQGDGQTLFGSIRVPDVVSVYAPEIPILLRRMHGFYLSTSPPVAALFDLPAGILLFMIVNLPGALLLGAFENSWAEVKLWQGGKPIWAAILFAVMATNVILVCAVLELPPLSGLRLSPLAVIVAALFAGIALGAREPEPDPLY